LVFTAAPMLAWAGGRLREHHRWAVDECVVAGRPQFCKWRTVVSDGNLDGEPAVKGVWNGVGLALPGAPPGKNAAATVETELVLAQGDYTLSAALDISPFNRASPAASGSVSFSTNGQPLSPAVSLADVAGTSREGETFAWSSPLRHRGGSLRFRVKAEVSSPLDRALPTRLWLSDLHVTPVIVIAP
jgi:hypothetical protein